MDILVLRAVALERQYGWALAQRIHRESGRTFFIQQGSLYPSLRRLERRGWVKAKWGTSDNNRRAKYYELTKTGRKQLEVEQDSWKKLAAAIAQVLETA